MKRLVYILLFVCVNLASATFAQRTVTFNDGNTLTVKGRFLGTVTEKNFEGQAHKKLYAYYQLQDNVVTLSIYSEWMSGSMDELKVYEFNVNLIHPSGLYDVIEYPLDEFYTTSYYSLSLSANVDMAFPYKVYNVYTSTPESRSFSLITITLDAKQPLDEVYNDLLPLIPQE